MKGKWQVLGEKTVFKNKHSHIETWKVRTHRGKEKEMTMARGGDFMVMLGVDRAGKFVTIRQHYVNENRKIYSLVAGYIDAGEKKAAAAKREFREEAGYDCDKIIYLGKSNKGKYVTGYAYYFLALGAFPCQKQALEEAEDIDVALLGKKKFIELLKQNKLLDVFTEACAWRALKYLKLV